MILLVRSNFALFEAELNGNQYPGMTTIVRQVAYISREINRNWLLLFWVILDVTVRRLLEEFTGCREVEKFCYETITEI